MRGCIPGSDVETFEDLTRQAEQALSFSDNMTLRVLGMTEDPHVRGLVDEAFKELLTREWLADEDGRPALTDAARRHLRRATRLH